MTRAALWAESLAIFAFPSCVMLLIGLLVGCLGSAPPPQDARAVLDQHHRELDRLNGESRGVMLGLQLACGYQERVPALQQLCPRVKPLGLALDSAFAAADLALSAADSGLTTVQESEKTVGALKQLVLDLRILLGEVTNAGVAEGEGRSDPATVGGQPGAEAGTPAGNPGDSVAPLEPRAPGQAGSRGEGATGAP